MTTSTLVFIACIALSSGQDVVFDHSLFFMDMNGFPVGYDIQYITRSRYQLDISQKERLFAETRKIAFAYGRKMSVADFYSKRDSVEKKFTDDILSQARQNKMKMKEVKILNLVIPKQIADAIRLRATTLNEPQPTRLRSYGE